MSSSKNSATEASPASLVLAEEAAAGAARPVWLVRDAQGLERAGLTPAQRAWIAAQGFKGQARRHVLLPASDGGIAGAVLGLGSERRRAQTRN